MQSDKKFILFRRFGNIHVRLLLHKQDDISMLEKKLDELDNNDTNAFFLNSRRADQNAERHAVLTELESKIKEYGKSRRPCLLLCPLT